MDDRGLSLLGGLENLRFLDLEANPIGDPGLQTIRTFKSLEEVRLTGTAVTEEGLAALRRDRPALKIVR